LNDRVLDRIKAIANGEIEKKAKEDKEPRAQIKKPAAVGSKKTTEKKGAKQVAESATSDPIQTTGE
jgi:hypothetical protein